MATKIPTPAKQKSGKSQKLSVNLQLHHILRPLPPISPVLSLKDHRRLEDFDRMPCAGGNLHAVAALLRAEEISRHLAELRVELAAIAHRIGEIREILLKRIPEIDCFLLSDHLRHMVAEQPPQKAHFYL